MKTNTAASTKSVRLKTIPGVPWSHGAWWNSSIYATGHRILTLLSMSLAIALPAVASSPGALDPTFDTDGKLTTSFGSYTSIGQSVAIQSDGKIVAAGISMLDASTGDFALARYNPDGSLDTSFGTGGKVTTSFGSSGRDQAWAVAIYKSGPHAGKIVAAGDTTAGGPNVFALARYNPNGSLDTTFGGGTGKVTTDFRTSPSDISPMAQAFSVALQTDDKIVASGAFFKFYSTGWDFALARYNADGSLDTSFGGTGKVITNVGAFPYGGGDAATSVAIQGDGKIVAAGYANPLAESNADFALVRYEINGTLDATFGVGGKVTTEFGTVEDNGKSVAIQSDGKIVVAGKSGGYPSGDFALARYNANGSLDTTFGSGGKVTTNIGGWDFGEAMALQSDGGIVVAGYTYSASFALDFAVARYNANGSLDTSFDTDGKVTADFGGGPDAGHAVAIQSDGKIVVAGSGGATTTVFAVARFGGTPPPSPAGQTIDFAPLAGRTFGDAPFALNATASSGLPVSFSIVSGPATLSGNTVTITGAGSAVVRASQAGNANYNPAPDVDRTLTISPALLVVTAQDATRVYGQPNPPLTLSYSGFVNGDTVATLGAVPVASTTATTASHVGTYAITISGGLAANYAFSYVPGTLNITPAAQTIDFAVVPDHTFGDAPFALTVTSSSGLPVSVAVLSGPATVAGNVVTVTGAGPVELRATQAGNIDYTAAVAVDRSFTVAKAAASVALTNLNHVYSGAPKSATATTTPAGLTVVVTYDGGAPAPTDAGAYAVAATITDPNYTGSATGLLVIAKAPQTIAFANPGDKTYGAAPFTVSATASSGLAVTFSAVSGPATISGNLVTLTGAGIVVLQATQAGNTNFLAATADVTFSVAGGTATIELADLVQAYDGTPKSVTAVTNPAGLAVTLTYNGSVTPPTLPGSYAVVATVNDGGYSGNATGTLVITITALVRHAPDLNGAIDGSLQVLTAENMALTGNAWVSGDILVPGTPTVRLNGHPTLVATHDGTGSATPSNYQVTLNGNALVRYLVRRTDPIAMPTVSAPPAPTGTRNVTLNSASDSPGSFATLRNLTLNGNVGPVAVPAGTYGTFTANGNSRFVLGVAGATTPAVYNFQGLTLNGKSQLEIAGPVVVRLAGGVTFNSDIGSDDHPEWLTLLLASGGVTLNGIVTFNGSVIAPSGTITLNGNSELVGNVACDRLTLNGNAVLTQPDPKP